ncbi:MAG: sugar-binding domain-containing protein [Bacteroidales bacterium]
MPFVLMVFLYLLPGCSHDYKSNVLRLETYQWNFWPEPDAVPGADSLYVGGRPLSGYPQHQPSCSWEVLERGNGKLVRIPAQAYEYFPATARQKVSWFHCRHTLPKLWHDHEITLSFEGVSHRAEIYLNEQLVGIHLGKREPFELDVTPVIYYTRDNHLAIRVYDPDPDSCGITGTIHVIASGVNEEGVPD